LSNGAAQRGISRERDLVKRLRKEGWIAIRAPASLGVADVIAMKAGERNRLYECKSTKRTYERFGPADRLALKQAARTAGAEAFLYWHPSRKGWTEIPAQDWPPA